MKNVPADSEIVELKAIVKGHVQGVGFRATALDIAQPLGIKGSFRNLSDGNVEILVQGKKTSLEKLLERLYQYFLISSIDKEYRQPAYLFDRLQML